MTTDTAERTCKTLKYPVYGIGGIADSAPYLMLDGNVNISFPEEKLLLGLRAVRKSVDITATTHPPRRREDLVSVSFGEKILIEM